MLVLDPPNREDPLGCGEAKAVGFGGEEPNIEDPELAEPNSGVFCGEGAIAAAAPKADVDDGVADPNIDPPVAAGVPKADWTGVEPNALLPPNTDPPVLGAWLVVPPNTDPPVLGAWLVVPPKTDPVWAAAPPPNKLLVEGAPLPPNIEFWVL